MEKLLPDPQNVVIVTRQMVPCEPLGAVNTLSVEIGDRRIDLIPPIADRVGIDVETGDIVDVSGLI